MTNTLDKIIGNVTPYLDVTEEDVIKMSEYWNSIGEKATDGEIAQAIQELRNIKEKKEYEKSNY